MIFRQGKHVYFSKQKQHLTQDYLINEKIKIVKVDEICTVKSAYNQSL